MGLLRHDGVYIACLYDECSLTNRSSLQSRAVFSFVSPENDNLCETGLK